jgi:hypothetical protein
MEFGLRERLMFCWMFPLIGIARMMPLKGFLVESSRSGMGEVSEQSLVFVVCFLIPVWAICAGIWMIQKNTD